MQEITDATAITLDGVAYRPRVTYPLLRAWCYMMGRAPSWTRDEVSRATADDAPIRTVYFGLDDDRWIALSDGHRLEERLAKIGIALGLIERADDMHAYTAVDIEKAIRYCRKRGEHDAADLLELYDDSGIVRFPLAGTTASHTFALGALAYEVQMREGTIR